MSPLRYLSTPPLGRPPIRGAVALVVGALLALRALAGTPVPLAAQWPQGVHHLGDRVLLTVVVPVPEAQYFVTGTLAPGTLWGDTRVAASQQVPPKAFPGNLTLQITVQAFAVGGARLTPVPLTVNTSKGAVEYLLQPPPLEIAPLLKEGEGPPPFLPPVPYPRPFPWALLLGGLALLLLAAALARWTVLKVRRARSERQIPVKPQEADPDRWIREEVDRIFRADSPPRIKYGLLSQRLREYLLLRTSLPFPDWTTEECSRYGSRSPLLGQAEREHLVRTLRLSDLAKFAKFVPSRKDEESARAGVLELLDGLSRNLDASKAGAA